MAAPSGWHRGVARMAAAESSDDSSDDEAGATWRALHGPELQLDVLLFQNPRRRGELHSARGEHGLGIPHPIRFEKLESLKQLRRYIGQDPVRTQSVPTIAI